MRTLSDFGFRCMEIHPKGALWKRLRKATVESVHCKSQTALIGNQSVDKAVGGSGAGMAPVGGDGREGVGRIMGRWPPLYSTSSRLGWYNAVASTGVPRCTAQKAIPGNIIKGNFLSSKKKIFKYFVRRLSRQA